MLEIGDRVTVTADWLGIRRKAKGTVLLCGFRDPVEYLVQFRTGKHWIPAVHLSCAHSSRGTPLFPPMLLPPVSPSYYPSSFAA
jgi:hypothetical protein